MANIDTYLQAIMDAVYGEQVRGSIHDAIALINNVSEAVLTIGTDVTSPTSSSTGFFEDSLYVNSNTWDLWKCTGTDTWSLEGNIKGETGNGIASITKTSTNVLVDTYTILFTDGTHTTFDVTNGKSIVSIAKTSTSGLVDTYTITFNDTTTTTFTVTNGIDGNRWFRGTDISGKAVNPTVYVNSGITDARPNDYYLNPSEGAVYYCVTGGDAATATWSYELTMSGGGGGGNLSDLGDVSLVSLQNGQFLKYNTTTSKWENANITFADLTDSNINSPSEGQILTYNGTTGKWENRDIDKSVIRYGGAMTFNDLITNQATIRTAANEDTFYLITTTGTLDATTAQYFTSQYSAGSEITADSHIAVINVGTEANPDYRFDDFGGWVDLSPLTPKTIVTSNDAFDPLKTYSAGEWLIHQGVLYEVITACTGVTPPNATYYNPITLHELKNRIDAVNSKPKSGFGSITIPADSTSVATITFANPYPQGTSYAVTISQSGTYGYTYSGIFVGTRDRTPTGFTVVVSSTRTAEIPINYAWIAYPITQ